MSLIDRDSMAHIGIIFKDPIFYPWTLCDALKFDLCWISSSWIDIWCYRIALDLMDWPVFNEPYVSYLMPPSPTTTCWATFWICFLPLHERWKTPATRRSPTNTNVTLAKLWTSPTTTITSRLTITAKMAVVPLSMHRRVRFRSGTWLNIKLFWNMMYRHR